MYIRHYRELAGMTQSELAQLLRINQRAVSQWETGETIPRADKLPQLARILGCTINDLFEDNEKAASNG